MVTGEDVLFDVYFTDAEITDYRSTLTANSETMGAVQRGRVGERRLQGRLQVLHLGGARRERRGADVGYIQGSYRRYPLGPSADSRKGAESSDGGVGFPTPLIVEGMRIRLFGK